MMMRRIIARFQRGSNLLNLMGKAGGPSTKPVFRGISTVDKSENVKILFGELTSKKHSLPKDGFEDDVEKREAGLSIFKGLTDAVEPEVTSWMVNVAIMLSKKWVTSLKVDVNQLPVEASIFKGLTEVVEQETTSWKVNITNLLSDVNLSFFKSLMNAAIGDATGAALFWKLLETYTILANSSSLLIPLFLGGRWVVKKYKQRKIEKLEIPPNNEAVYVFKMAGLVEGTAKSWIDKRCVLHVSGVKRKGDKPIIIGLTYQLPTALCSLISATHYPTLELVAVKVKYQDIEEIDVGLDVKGKEIKEMIGNMELKGMGSVRVGVVIRGKRIRIKRKSALKIQRRDRVTKRRRGKNDKS